MKIIIGSKNQPKMQAVISGFQRTGIETEVISCSVPSGVSEQPFSDEETITGAVNRAKRALDLENGDLGVGLEGGVVKTPHGLFLCNWGALFEKEKPPIIAGGARILLPDEVAELLLQGEELGPVMDRYTKRQQIRQKEGAIGVFTNGLVTREEMFTHVVHLLAGQWLTGALK
ncbi:inosine/xanthosine triphosphatase [Bacillus ectoiniformans]|uniref:DUF84 family protein n=1 Tax=Bacillus ectoiniformans TaxID=1494429 RepID=UPI00195BE234|nr:DUF84 family protein [Bacillus ectoiniformans]MBM7649658.1 inosine/xanthosine triphosphatase [Bacillus ectoiniformans]